MARPKSPGSSAEFELAIERARRTHDAEIAALTARKRAAEAAENQRRGELLTGYLSGPHAVPLRAALAPAVAPRDRALFGLGPDTGTRERQEHAAAEFGAGGPGERAAVPVRVGATV